MFRKPFLVKCENRRITPRFNQKSGEPESWLTPTCLELFKLYSVSFDFFVNWKTSSLSTEAWIKRVVNSSVSQWPISDENIIRNSLNECDGQYSVGKFIGFCSKYNLIPKYILFKESNDWGRSPSSIVIFSPLTKQATLLSLEELKSSIRDLSGGKVEIGKKKLKFGPSTLECYLSNTDALWPGDVDTVIYNNHWSIKAILEFKKHNLNSPIEAQKLSNVYPWPDGRKYDRLAIFRDYFDPQIPIIIVYYPTLVNHTNIKLELLGGRPFDLKSSGEHIISIPEKYNTDTHIQFIKKIMTMI